MSTILVLNDILRVAVWSTDGGQGAVTTLHAQVTAVGAPPFTDQDVVDTVDSTIAASYKSLINNNATYRGVQIQKIWPNPIAVDTQSTANSGAGTSGATSLPKQCSGITSFYTAFAGRSQRGRAFMPFPATSSDTGDGIPTGGYIATLGGMWTAMRALTAIAVAGRTGTLQWGIYHRVSHTLTPIVVQVTRAKWATQRRRGDFGRPNSSPI